MSEFHIEYTQEAQRDILSISDYHLKMVGIQSAECAVNRLLDHIEKLAQFPLMGEEHPDERLRELGIRKLVHDNHIVVYRVLQAEKSVVIDRVFWASSEYPELMLQKNPT